jgi:beta-glucanase (GH16 family)
MTPRSPRWKHPRRDAVVAGVATLALVAGGVQLLPSAGADEVVVRQVSSNTDAGVVDVNRDGRADYASYGVTNSALSVGEQPRDGSDLRLLLPFDVNATALDAVKGGGSANVSMRVWRADNLGGRKIVIDALTGAGASTTLDYSRAGTGIASVAPVEGRLAVDVTSAVKAMSAPGVFTMRIRLDQLAPQTGGQLTQVNIATSEARSADNRPVLSVSSGSSAAPSRPTVTVPTTTPPETAPPLPPPTVPTTTPPPPVDPTDPPVASTGQPPALVTGGASWRTIFDDEFDGSSVDAANWNVMNNSNYGTGNNEDQCYRAGNTTVAGGTLRLTGKRETVTGCGSNPDGGSSYFFTSGMVTTRQQGGNLKFKYRHGYTEVRMRVPRGNLYWPAFWLVGAGDGSSPGWPDYGEFDVTEIYGAKPDISESNFHRAGGNIGARNHNVTTKGTSSSLSINDPNPLVSGGTNDWHTYGFNWTDNTLQWFIDGVLVRTYTASSAADSAALSYEHSIILNLAMGGNGPRYSDHGYTGIESGGGYNDGNLNADLPGTMEIDYVRVWQQ